MLETFRKLAEITQRQGAEAHQRMLDQVDRIRNGHNVTTVSGHDHQVEINTRLKPPTACTRTFGPGNEGIVVVLILEDQQRVVVVSATWFEQ